MNHQLCVYVGVTFLISALVIGSYFVPARSSSSPSADPALEQYPCGPFKNCSDNVTINGTSYPVRYDIFGEAGGDPEGLELVDIQADTNLKAISVQINSNQNGTFVIELPRSLTTALGLGRDTEFIVLVDGEKIDHGIADSDESTIFNVKFGKGAENLLIGDSRIIPEFGPVMIAVASAAIGLLLTFNRFAIRKA